MGRQQDSGEAEGGLPYVTPGPSFLDEAPGAGGPTVVDSAPPAGMLADDVDELPFAEADPSMPALELGASTEVSPAPRLEAPDPAPSPASPEPSPMVVMLGAKLNSVVPKTRPGLKVQERRPPTVPQRAIPTAVVRERPGRGEIVPEVLGPPLEPRASRGRVAWILGAVILLVAVVFVWVAVAGGARPIQIRETASTKSATP